MDLKQEMQDMAKSMPIMKNTLERWAAEIDRVKAEAVRDAVSQYKIKTLDGPNIYSEGLLDYANKLEQGK